MADGGATSIEELARDAEAALAALLPGAVCIAQEWDGRIDCLFRTDDGRVIGEMVPVEEISVARIRATGARLACRLSDPSAVLVNEIHEPTYIRKE